MDLQRIEYEASTPEEWQQVIEAMHSGEQASIHVSIFDYFLEVLPPKRMGAGWFVFAEGDEAPTLFWQSPDYKHSHCQRFDSYRAISEHLGVA